MAERLKRAAAWLGLVTDDRYGEEDDRNQTFEQTEGISRDELMAQSHDTGPVHHGEHGSGAGKGRPRWRASAPRRAARTARATPPSSPTHP